MKQFTEEEIKQGDGQEGRPALVVVEGKVYDVSASGMWAGGEHMNSHTSGADLSLALEAAPHGADVMERVEQVGELADGAAEPAQMRDFPTPGPLAKLILSFHPHPVSVHFPIALGVIAAAFMAVYLAFGVVGFEVAALLNLCVAAITAPPAIFTGLLSWHYNYGGVWTPIFRKKAILSVVLMVLLPAAAALRLLAPESFGPGEELYWVYAAMVVVGAPAVVGLGFLGGNITFPR